MATPDGVEFAGPLLDRYDEVLTPAALEPICLLHREFNGRRTELLVRSCHKRGAHAIGEVTAEQLFDVASTPGEVTAEGLRTTISVGIQYLEEEMVAIRERIGEDAFASGGWDEARATFLESAVADEYADFPTLPAYEQMP